MCFVFPRREEVGCFHLVVWYPKKASSTWCLIGVMTGAGPPKTFWLYSRLHDCTKQFRPRHNCLFSYLIWHFVAIQAVWCAFPPYLTAGYFFKAVLDNISRPHHSQLSMPSNVFIMLIGGGGLWITVMEFNQHACGFQKDKGLELLSPCFLLFYSLMAENSLWLCSWFPLISSYVDGHFIANKRQRLSRADKGSAAPNRPGSVS